MENSERGNGSDEPVIKEQSEQTSHEQNHENQEVIPDDTSHEEVDPGGDYTIFNQVLYLGAATINAPRCEPEIRHNMEILNEQSKENALEVSVSVPSCSDGIVVIYDITTNNEMVRYPINRILFCARGKVDTPESCCFAFTCSHGDSKECSIFQCHVFRCQIPEAVGRVLMAFASAFRRPPFSKENQSLIQEVPRMPLALEHLLHISLEIKEDDSKGGFSTIPRDKECFKMRSNLEKQLVIVVSSAPSAQDVTSYLDPNCDLTVERCFGLLVASGRRVKHADMNLLEMVSMGSSSSNSRCYTISGQWNPVDPVFTILNRETPKDMHVFMTVAIDLVMRGIQEPVRFVVETKVRVYPSNERFWYFSKRPLVQLFSLRLKQAENCPVGSEQQYVVESVSSLGDVDRSSSAGSYLSLNISSLKAYAVSSMALGRSTSIVSTPGGDDSDDDEPLLSGSGDVSKDCPEAELDVWRDVLLKWQGNPEQGVPKEVGALVCRGVPEALRGEVWLLLAGISDASEMMETYRLLLLKDCSCEQIILRDIHRTFPAHDYFKEAGGVGQDSLYKISKAYAVYDEEVGYCQGLSFLAAALLLHMPEEQAFSLMVKIMFDHGLRDLFKDGFEVLHLRLYQLGRLLESQIPDLWTHFQEQGIETHMYASQWFLTLYTAKFPLFMAYHFLDIFLLLGIDSVFQVALALLQMSKKELLSMDFEGILKYFRVSMPKKYRSDDVARHLFRSAVAWKVKKIKKYEKEYFLLKEREAMQQDPLIRLENENRRFIENIMRLERENDDLAHELVTSKINLRINLDQVEDKCESLTKEVSNLKILLSDNEDEKLQLATEVSQVKEILKREVDRGESDGVRNAAIIADYKNICTTFSERLDKEQNINAQALNALKAKVSSCEHCRELLSPVESPPLTLEDSEESPFVSKLQLQVRELELELAQTKLALVESQCKNQDLTHQLTSAINELQSPKSTWLQKTFTSFSTSLKERNPNGTAEGGGKDPSDKG